MDPNDLIDRYVHAVTHTLRSAERDDVARELRTLIEDMLAERADAAAPDEATVIEVLRHLGPPDEVAERYGQPRPYLVGPAYYPVFKLVTTIVLAVLGIVYLVGVVASLAFWEEGPQPRWEVCSSRRSTSAGPRWRTSARWRSSSPASSAWPPRRACRKKAGTRATSRP